MYIKINFIMFIKTTAKVDNLNFSRFKAIVAYS